MSPEAADRFDDRQCAWFVYVMLSTIEKKETEMEMTIADRLHHAVSGLETELSLVIVAQVASIYRS